MSSAELAIDGEIVDAERELVESGYHGGPVDAEPDTVRTLYATVTSQGTEGRAPILPAWLRSPEQRGAFIRASLDVVLYSMGFHCTRIPRYAFWAALYAPLGALRGLGKVVRWWWVWEQHGVRQQAANSGDSAAWMRLHQEVKATRSQRGLILGMTAGVTGIALLLFLVLASLLVQLLVLAALVAVLARHGRPEGRPIIDRVYTGPKFTKLHAEQVRTALCALGISGIKDPSLLEFPPPGIHRDGPGWLARVNLPAGVEAVDVLERRGRLSSALRLPVDQVWPAAGPDHAGQLDLWVGYMPASKMGPPRWSLLADNARTSVFEANEFGTDQRQRPVRTILFARNFLVGGVPGSGKSYGARALATIAMLDPTCELKIAEYKGTGDFGDMAHLCSTYVCGVDDASFEAGRALVSWLLAECERRGARIRKAKEAGLAPEGKVTPELAAMPGSGLHPILALIDESHELLGYDKLIAADLERAIKRGRALGIIIILATQIPDKTSLPPNITRCVTIRWCLAVLDQIANDMVLGTGAYKRGLAATAYRPGLDAGWGIAIGLEASGPVRGHYPSPEETKKLVDRATVLRGGVVRSPDDVTSQPRDIVDDVLAVYARTGARRLHRPAILAGLVDLCPEHYSSWTVDMLGDALRKAGVPVVDVKVAGIVGKGVKIEDAHATTGALQLSAEVAAEVAVPD